MKPKGTEQFPEIMSTAPILANRPSLQQSLGTLRIPMRPAGVRQ